MAWVNYVLSREADAIKIVVQGSPLLKTVEGEEQYLQIQHDINRLYLETFKGSYRIVEEDGKKAIVITYPIK
ncbi:MAG: hypothetical protein LUE99_04315 [Bacteroides sp.]|nr:hypothetical protein [Bacteroides sp.]